MSEQVQTGGLMKFQYGKNVQLALDPERKDAIDVGYLQAEERRRRERKNKFIFWVIVILIIILILGYILIKK